MNVAFVVHHYDGSEGTGGYVAELLPRIARHHEVTLYTSSVRAPVPDGVDVIRVPAVRGRAYATILSFPYAFAAVRRRHDLIHAQGWVAPRADIVTAHIVLAAWRHAAREASAPVARGERLFGGFVARREARLLCTARAVIAPSERARSDIARHYGRRDGVHVVPHGFPAVSAVSAPRARDGFGVPPDAFAALYVGDARKGLVPAIDAIAGTPAAHLMVVSHSASGAYLDHATTRGVRDRIHWVGPQPDMAAAYAASDVLLHPTIYDTFGLVVSEAMSAGLPAIVGREAGVSELITPGESGCVVSSPDEAARALNALSRDPARRRALAERGREIARRNGWDLAAQRTLAVYDAVWSP